MELSLSRQVLTLNSLGLSKSTLFLHPSNTHRTKNDSAFVFDNQLDSVLQAKAVEHILEKRQADECSSYVINAILRRNVAVL